MNPQNSSTPNPFSEALLKRKAQFSTVTFIKTLDPQRLQPFLRFVHRNYKKDHEPVIFLYRPWSGLYRVEVREDMVNFTPVSASPTAASPLAQAIQADQRIRSLDAALAYIDQAMERGRNVVAVFWGLFSYYGVSQTELYSFIKFLRNAIFTEDYYIRRHWVIVFTDSPESIVDEDTLKHSVVIAVPPSTEKERRRILSDIASQMGLNILKQLNGQLNALVEATRGLNLHEVESVALESLFRYHRLDPAVMTQYKNEIVRKSGLLDIEQPEHGFEAVGGYDVVKRFIQTNIVKVLRNPAKAQRLGLRPPRGILLFGPPGTGKTLFARALAKELGLPFLRLRTEKIVSKWYGEASRNMAKALEIAEAVAPAVLFVDEIDRFGQRGGIAEHEETRRVFSIFLEWLGDNRRKTIVLGTTNRPQDLDEAFIRVGRFDYIVPMLYPDRAAREQILKVHTSVVRRVPLDNVDLGGIADSTELWTGAELEELVLRAARMALREDAEAVSQRHFAKALATFKINMDERQQQLQRYLKLAETFTNDAEFLSQLKSSYAGTRVSAALEEMGE